MLVSHGVETLNFGGPFFPATMLPYPVNHEGILSHSPDWLKVATAAARSDPGDTFLPKVPCSLLPLEMRGRETQGRLMLYQTPNYVNEWRPVRERFGSGTRGAAWIFLSGGLQKASIP